MNLGCLSGSGSKLGLPRVTMGLNESLNRCPRSGLEKKATRVLMGHQGIAINDMCEEDKMEGLQYHMIRCV